MGVGKQFTSTVVRQGWLSAKYWAYSRLKVWKSRCMLTKNTVTSTKFSHLLPDASSTERTFWNTEWHWASKSKWVKLPHLSNCVPGMVVLSLGSRGPMPDKNNKLPTLRACGYKPTALGACWVVMRLFCSCCKLNVCVLIKKKWKFLLLIVNYLSHCTIFER